MDFEGAWGKLQANNCLQGESRTKYMRQPLVFVKEDWALGCNYIKFRDFLDLS